MKKIYLIILLLQSILLNNLAISQNINRAEKDILYFQYTEAIPKLEKIIEKDKQGTEKAIVLLADCYRQIMDIPKAIEWYSIAIKLEQVAPIVHYHYGQMLRSSGQYEEAGKQFTIYNSLVPDDQKGAMYKEHCELIIEWQSLPDVATVSNLESLNSENADFSPVILNNEIIFSSDRDLNLMNKEIYSWTGVPFLTLVSVSQHGDETPEEWSFASPDEFSRSLNNQYHDGTAVFSEDGNRMLFTRSERDSKVKKGEENVRTDILRIYTCTKENDKWSKPIPFYLNSNDYSIGHPALSSGDSLLYFVSDMPGGNGGTDIYVCKWNGKGWHNEKNLGSTINTVGNEMFPYVHKDGSLYFSSTGHLGFGGMDIFKTEKAQESWNEPVNMMLPINSSYDDFGIVIVKDDSTGLISSNRPGGLGSDDIYAFTMLPMEEPEPEPEPILVAGRVITKDYIPIVEATVFVLNHLTDEVLILKTDAKGMYEYVVDTNANYMIQARKTNYLKDCLSYYHIEPDSKPNDLVLIKLEADLVFEVENIYYDLDMWYIREDAEPELNEIVELMEEHPIKIELSSHTDSRASFKYNASLSQKRAESAVAFIISQGVDPERITAMGYGESRLINRCSDGIDCSEDQHQMNRRTEFRIMEVKQKNNTSTDQLAGFLHGEVYQKDQLESGYFNDCEVTVLK